jgi:hypothetical protein
VECFLPISYHFEGFKPPTVKPVLFFANFVPLHALFQTEMYHKKDYEIVKNERCSKQHYQLILID